MKIHFLLLLVICSILPAPADSFTLQSLMYLFQQRPTLQARFRETRTDSYLQIPITYSGQVRFKAPDYLEKITEKPSYQSFILDGKRVTLTNRSQPAKTFTIAEYPEIKAFSASFLALLSGDLKTLQNYYSTSLSGSKTHWTLELTPLHSATRRQIESIRFEGSEGHLNKVITRQQSGNASEMVFLALTGDTVSTHD